jgi:hypothetical protein
MVQSMASVSLPRGVDRNEGFGAVVATGDLHECAKYQLVD